MKTEDDSIRFITDLDIKETNKIIEEKKIAAEIANKSKEKETKSKNNKKKPQIILEKGAMFKKGNELSQLNEKNNIKNIEVDIDDENELKKQDSSDNTDKKTQTLVNIVKMMNEK